ncbi:MAG: hypothetical protein HOW73_35130 [Polyangiaceae bacterium]|nr:hypothetical protein [Polyangiaceae bacterium]
MSDPLDVLWAHVLDTWDDDKRHQAFLAYCVDHGTLAEAAARYRKVAEASSEADVVSMGGVHGSGYRDLASRRDDAKKRLAAVALVAMSALDNQRTQPNTSRMMFGFKVFAGLFLLASLLALAWAFSGME